MKVITGNHHSTGWSLLSGLENHRENNLLHRIQFKWFHAGSLNPPKMTEWALQSLDKEKLKTGVVQNSAFYNHHIYSSSRWHSEVEHPGHRIKPSTHIPVARDIKPVPQMLPAHRQKDYALLQQGTHPLCGVLSTRILNFL